MIKEYVQLAKPGIVASNLLTAAAGFFYGARGALPPLLLLATLGGLGLVIASAAAANNYLDRGIDVRMERTRTRALPAGRLSPAAALAFSAIAGVLGLSLLAYFAGLLAFATALAAWVVYVLLYTPLKPRTPYALYVGAVAGAFPPVVGYVAAAHTLDIAAGVLFAFLFLWQIPHFLAIAVYRYEEYRAAGVPLFVAAPTEEARRKARRAFLYSLVVLVAWCAALMLQR